MDDPFRKPESLEELMHDIAEMSMMQALPSPMGGGLALTCYPWTPKDIEELPERERIWYRDAKRDVQKRLFDNANSK